MNIDLICTPLVYPLRDAFRNTFRALLLLTILLAPLNARTQCNCDHTVDAGATIVNGNEWNIRAGDVVCVMAGTYEFLRFQEIHGTPDAPVIITNCGGQVVIHNEDRAYGLVVEGASSNFHLSGSGDESVEYGFDISAPDTDPWPGVGLVLGDKSTNYEVDHLEIHHTGFAGVTCKTDPLCDGSADQDVFVQQNVSLHHLYVHETGGEGFYIGSTQSDGHTITCDGIQEVHQPHFLEGIFVHHNIIERTSWDGAQIGMARSDCAFYANTIQNVGGNNVEYQQQGLQIGTYSSCDVYNNIILDGPVMGIIVLGAGSSRFYNNLIVNFGEDGIYANHRDAVADAMYDIFFNTIVDYTRNGIRIHGENLGAATVQNNVIVGAEGQLAIGNEVPNVTESNNLVFASSEGLFAAESDFHPATDSPLRGAGVPVDITFDLTGMKRPNPPAVGAFEHPDDTTGPSTIEPPAPAESTGDQAGDDSGCGCLVSDQFAASSLLKLLF